MLRGSALPGLRGWGFLGWGFLGWGLLGWGLLGWGLLGWGLLSWGLQGRRLPGRDLPGRGPSGLGSLALGSWRPHRETPASLARRPLDQTTERAELRRRRGCAAFFARVEAFPALLAGLSYERCRSVQKTAVKGRLGAW
jgi:hypothetical protein